MLNRRIFTFGLGTMFVGCKKWGIVRPSLQLAAPNFSDDMIQGYKVGLRPYRTHGLRIERTETADKTIVYNYGHGGAGVTLSWGSAEVAAHLVEDKARSTPVAVIGAGVVGLSTAQVLVEMGFSVQIYAREFSPNTTSDVAGAEWSPDGVAHECINSTPLR